MNFVVAAGDLSHCSPAVAVNNAQQSLLPSGINELQATRGWTTVRRLAIRAPLLIRTHHSGT